MRNSKSDSFSILIGVTAFSSEGLGPLTSAVTRIHEKLPVLDSSSIYRVLGKLRRPAHIHDLRSVMTFEGLTLSLHCLTPLEPEDTLRFLFQVEESAGDLRIHRNISLNLLMFEEEIRLSPGLSLPHPDLHRRPDLLLPAAEVWPEKLHPVLRKDLQSLAKDLFFKGWGEFVAQKSQILKELPGRVDF